MAKVNLKGKQDLSIIAIEPGSILTIVILAYEKLSNSISVESSVILNALKSGDTNILPIDRNSIIVLGIDSFLNTDSNLSTSVTSASTISEMLSSRLISTTSPESTTTDIDTTTLTGIVRPLESPQDSGSSSNMIIIIIVTVFGSLFLILCVISSLVAYYYYKKVSKLKKIIIIS